MTNSDDLSTTRAQETTREAALERASRMAVDLGAAVCAKPAPREAVRPPTAAPFAARPAPRPLPRRRRRFLRFVATVALGVAGTLAWQSYGLEARRLIAAQLPALSARAPALAAVVAHLPPGILVPSDGGGEAPPTAAAVSATVVPAPATPVPDVVQQLETVVRELAAVREGMDRLAAVKIQMNGTIAKLQADEEARPPPAPPPMPVARPAARPAPPTAVPLPLTSRSTSSTTQPPRRPATAGP